jgi:uroporphyrinogen-III synthase
VTAEGGPLAGRRIVVTRGTGQAAALVEALRERGATVIEVPAVEFAPPADDGPLRAALAAVAGYDWLLLTSANAVRAVAALAPDLPPGLRVASAGPATTCAVRAALRGAAVAAEAADPLGAEGLARALSTLDVDGARMLFPVSDRSPAVLAETLRARGARVDVVAAYRTTAPAGTADRVREALRSGADAITFASPSAVEAVSEIAEALELPAIAIGETTADAARAAGFGRVAVARTQTAQGLAQAVSDWFGDAVHRR